MAGRDDLRLVTYVHEFSEMEARAGLLGRLLGLALFLPAGRFGAVAATTAHEREALRGPRVGPLRPAPMLVPELRRSEVVGIPSNVPLTEAGRAAMARREGVELILFGTFRRGKGTDVAGEEDLGLAALLDGLAERVRSGALPPGTRLTVVGKVLDLSAVDGREEDPFAVLHDLVAHLFALGPGEERRLRWMREHAAIEAFAAGLRPPTPLRRRSAARSEPGGGLGAPGARAGGDPAQPARRLGPQRRAARLRAPRARGARQCRGGDAPRGATRADRPSTTTASVDGSHWGERRAWLAAPDGPGARRAGAGPRPAGCGTADGPARGVPAAHTRRDGEGHGARPRPGAGSPRRPPRPGPVVAAMSALLPPERIAADLRVLLGGTGAHEPAGGGAQGPRAARHGAEVEGHGPRRPEVRVRCPEPHVAQDRGMVGPSAILADAVLGASPGCVSIGRARRRDAPLVRPCVIP